MPMRHNGCGDFRKSAAAGDCEDQSRSRRSGAQRLIATQMLGLALCRYVLQLPPIVDMPHDEAVAWLGPTVQRYLDAP